ncbi:MAG: hypothetical protein ACOC7N_02420, partial [Chloroflexota bacterium]
VAEGPVYKGEHQAHLRLWRGWLTAGRNSRTVGIFSTFGPASGSIEGLIYITLPIRGQLAGLSGVLLQSLLLSAVTYYWMRHTDSRWLD